MSDIGIGIISRSKFIPNPAGLFTLLVSPGGTVGREIIKAATLFVPVAKAAAPVGETGNLKMSIEVTDFGIEATPAGPGPVAEVAVNISYAMAVHTGSPPRTIEAKNAKVLKFPAKGAGPTGPFAYARVVHQPAIPPNPFFFESLVVFIQGRYPTL